MMWLKACSRCRGGDLVSDKDIYGECISCVQCGHYLSPAEEAMLRGQEPPKEVAETASPGHTQYGGNPLRMHQRRKR